MPTDQSIIITENTFHPFLQFIEQIARFETEDEMDEKGGVMENDDAVASINHVICSARTLLAKHRLVKTTCQADKLLSDLMVDISWNRVEGLKLQPVIAYMESAEHRQAQIKFDRDGQLDSISTDELDFTFDEWQHDVAQGNTRRGYADWVLSNREQALEDNHDAVGELQ